MGAFGKNVTVYRRLTIITLTFLLVGAQLLASEPPLQLRLALPDIPTAAVVGAEGVILNPAALYINEPMAFQFYHSFASGSLSGDNGFLVATGGLGFAYQRLGLGVPSGVSRYDFAVSSKVIDNLYTGLSYTYYKTDWALLDKAHSWNYSVIWHLPPAASLSAKFENLNRNMFAGQETSIGYMLGLAFQPMGDKVTFGGDAKIFGGQSLSEAQWRLSARAYVKTGLQVYAGMGNGQRFGFGFEMQFGQSSVGAESFFSSDDGYDRTTVYGTITGAVRKNLFLGHGRILQMNVTGDIPEEKQQPLFFWPFWPARETVYEKLLKIKVAREDPSIKGILLIIDKPQIGWGKLADFRAALQEFADAGKPIICYLGTFSGTGSYYLASVADSVFTAPVDALYLTGLRADVRFYGEALRKLDVKPEIEKIGKYKTAPNSYTDSTLTPEHREALGALLDDIYDEITARIADSRGMTASALQDVIDRGPFTSVQAESLGLIDGRLYPGDIPNRLPNMFGRDLTLLPSAKYVTGPKFNERFYTPPQIAIVTVEGSIVGGTSGSSLIMGKTAGSATLSAVIRSCANVDRIKAIVVRLDTPGGNAAASDLIWGELNRAHQSKPVVVSMSDVCASGGYYIASASDQILVEPTTVTGSIGVFGGKADISGLYHKLGLTTATIKRGRNADFFSLTSPYSDEERAILRRQVSDLYRNFISLVADSRHLSTDSVDAIAQGRVWSGSSALRLGLADREGTLLDAVNSAAELAGLRDDDYQVVEIPMRASWPGVPNLMVMGIASLIGVTSPSGLENGILPLAAGDDGTPQYRLPYDISIK